MKIRNTLCALLSIVALNHGIPALAGVTEEGNNTQQTLTSIGDALSSPDKHPVHIIYIHGINAIGAGDSEVFRKSICTQLKLCNPSDWQNAGTEYVDKGEFAEGKQPPSLTYLGRPVWNPDTKEWYSAAPFVVHWVVHLKGYAPVLVVDEINWWPLVLSLKCRQMVAREADLAGPDINLLGVCSQSKLQDPGGLGRFFPWLTEAEAKELAAKPARAVLINRSLKDGLLDWGFSDAILGVGTLGDIIRDGLRQLLHKSAAFDPNGTGIAAAANRTRADYDWEAQLDAGKSQSGAAKMDQEFIAVTHSLGSYLLFNTLHLESNPALAAATSPEAQAGVAEESREDRAIEYIFSRMSLVYFFANQISLLELVDLEDKTGPVAAGQANVVEHASRAAGSPRQRLDRTVSKWAEYQSQFQISMHPTDSAARQKRQIVAWSDPSDLLTWRVPEIGGIQIENLYVQNATHWFWLVESPLGAHDNYAKNKHVLRLMFRNIKPARVP